MSSCYKRRTVHFVDLSDHQGLREAEAVQRCLLDLESQSGARPKSARKRIQEREDEVTQDSWNIVPSEFDFNAHNADGVFSKDRSRRADFAGAHQ